MSHPPMKRIAAITTHYAGRKFRSRVEARKQRRQPKLIPQTETEAA